MTWLSASRGSLAVWFARGENRRLAWRLLALASCGLLYYTLDWMVLRNGVAQGLRLVLSIWGHVSTVEAIDGGVLLIVDGVRFWISAQCTYVDLVLCLSPFLWRVGLPTRVNLGNLLLALVAVQGINFARLLGGHLALARGASWAWAHDLPDLLLWYPALTLAVLGALRTDQRQTRSALLPDVITEEKEAMA